MINYTKELLVEIREILKANHLLDYVGISESVRPIAEEQSSAAAYAILVKSIPRLEKASDGIDGYEWSGLFTVTVNVDCTSDTFLIYDVVDSINRSILNDSAIWSKLVDRDLVAIEYDNCEFSPKRTATIVVEARYRLTCE